MRGQLRFESSDGWRCIDSNTAPHCDDKVSFGSRQGAKESGSHKWTDLQLARKGEAMQGVVTQSVTHGGGVVYIEVKPPLRSQSSVYDLHSSLLGTEACSLHLTLRSRKFPHGRGVEVQMRSSGGEGKRNANTAEATLEGREGIRQKTCTTTPSLLPPTALISLPRLKAESI